MNLDFKTFCNKMCGINLTDLQEIITTDNDPLEPIFAVTPRQRGTSALVHLLAIYNVLATYRNCTVVHDNMVIALEAIIAIQNLEVTYKKYFNIDLKIERFQNYTLDFMISDVKIGTIIFIPSNNQLHTCIWGSKPGTNLYIDSPKWSFASAHTIHTKKQTIEGFLENNDINLSFFQTGLNHNKTVIEYFERKTYTIIEVLKAEELFSLQSRLLNMLGEEDYFLQYMCNRL